MIEQALNYFIGKVASFFSFLTTLNIAAGVSLGAFIAAIFIITALIKNFLFTAR